MLSWWVDKAKGYCLEDLENSKLIASQDIRFFKDDSSSNLASIKVQDTPANNQDVNTLVNDAIQKDITPLPIQKDDTLLKESPSPLAIPPFNDAEINSPTKVSRPNKVPNSSFLPAPWHSRRWWGSKGLITKQRWKQGQRGEISKLLHNCALNK